MRTLDSWKQQETNLRELHTEQTKAGQWQQAETTRRKLIMSLDKIKELEGAPKLESRGEILASQLLENEEKWNKAMGSTKDLFKLHQQATQLLREMARSIAYNRALASVGIKREDVSHPLVGDQVMFTDNYKKTHKVTVCLNPHCGAKGRPQKGAECRTCGEPLQPTDAPISPSDLRKTYQRHIVGVVLKDGRRLWFNEPMSNTPWTEWDKELTSGESPS